MSYQTLNIFTSNPLCKQEDAVLAEKLRAYYLFVKENSDVLEGMASDAREYLSSDVVPSLDSTQYTVDEHMDDRKNSGVEDVPAQAVPCISVSLKSKGNCKTFHVY